MHNETRLTSHYQYLTTQHPAIPLHHCTRHYATALHFANTLPYIYCTLQCHALPILNSTVAEQHAARLNLTVTMPNITQHHRTMPKRYFTLQHFTSQLLYTTSSCRAIQNSYCTFTLLHITLLNLYKAITVLYLALPRRYLTIPIRNYAGLYNCQNSTAHDLTIHIQLLYITMHRQNITTPMPYITTPHSTITIQY